MPKILTAVESSENTYTCRENQAVTSSTVLVDSDYLHYPVTAGVYKFSFGVVLTSSATGLHKLSLSVPSGSEVGVIANYSGASNSTSFTQSSARGTNVSTLALIAGGAGGQNVRVLGEGYIVIDTDGDVVFQFAQNTEHSTPTTLRTGSWATFTRMR